jgi:hypothetical protein
MNYLVKILANTLRDKSIERYIKFNTAKLDLKPNKKRKIVLIELGTNFTGTIALSYFTRIWHKEGHKLVGYQPTIHSNFFSKLLHFTLTQLSIDNGRNYPYRLARSIGIKHFLIIKYTRKEIKRTKTQARDIMSLSKSEILSYEINGVRVGDLFYDWHLRNRDLVTLDFKNKTLFKDLCLFLEFFYFWDLKLTPGEISTIAISHSVYLQGIPARIALSRDIEVLLISYDRVNRLNNNFMHSDLEYKLYDPNSMNQLGYEVNLQRAKKFFSKDISDNSKRLLIPGLVSGFHGVEKDAIISSSKKLKVLIAPHCFTDAPHSLGDFLFNDYWEWLIYICDKSKEFDYEWYIKPHPAFSHSEQNNFKQLLKNYPSIKIIESSVSNKSIFTQGLDAVITVQGSIGFEAAMFGILSICCSKNIPTRNYGFSVCAESKEELYCLIKGIWLLKSKCFFEEKSLMHFYDLHIVRKCKTWLFKDQSDQYFSKFKSYFEIFQSVEVFNIWIDEFYSQEIDKNRESEVRKFLESSKYLLELDLTST